MTNIGCFCSVLSPKDRWGIVQLLDCFTVKLLHRDKILKINRYVVLCRSGKKRNLLCIGCIFRSDSFPAFYKLQAVYLCLCEKLIINCIHVGWYAVFRFNVLDLHLIFRRLGSKNKLPVMDSQSSLLTLNLIPWKTQCKYIDFYVM